MGTLNRIMYIETRFIGECACRPARIIEVTITDDGEKSSITEDVTNSQRLVDTVFIDNLREVADRLEEQNNLVNNNLNT